ncbi:hypothetical protein VSR82_36445 [Burkholderia sp. JPY481]|uniref:hypothetical protein n=1 Tax=unclassified Paraburkholderia TaxID=2615204 RepID=UPI00318204BA
MRILLAEDDPLIGNGLRPGLRREGFAATPKGALAAVLVAMCSQAPRPQTHGGWRILHLQHKTTQ